MNDADCLHRFMTSLGAPYGFERSCKFSQNGLNDQRFLITQHVDYLPQQNRSEQNALVQFAYDQGLGDTGAEWLVNTLPKAELFHLGYESEPDGARFKVYCEFPFLPESSSATPLVHQAVKWNASDSRCVFTDYRLASVSSGADLVKSVSNYLEGSVLQVWFCEWLEARHDLDKIMMLDVTELDNPRQSFDLNLYDLELPLESVSGLAPILSQTYGIPLSTLTHFFTRNAHVLLGHLSAGVSRSGQSFLTLYFAVEEYAGE